MTQQLLQVWRKNTGQWALGVVAGLAVLSLAANPTLILGAGAPACSTTGAQNTAVLLVNFPGAALPSGVTTQALNNIFFDTSSGVSLNGFLQAASYGKTWAAGSVFGPYTLTGTYSTCGDVGGAVLDDAIAAAQASGVNFNNYSRVFLVFPDIFGCGWGGYAQVGGCSIYSTGGTLLANATAAYLTANAVTSRASGVEYASHEMGHNFGLLHSGAVVAPNSTDVLGPISSSGTFYDQGDYWSTMGEVVLGLYPAPQKAEVLGWMAPSTNYQVVQSSGTYTLQPLESTPAGLQALKVQRGTGNDQWLWIEYRQPMGSYDSTLLPQPYSGALIHYEDASTQTGHTYLPNFTPTDTSWNSPALAAGKTWVDPYSNLSISVQNATASGLTLSVYYGAASCTPAAPALAISPPDPSIYAGQIVNYTLTVTDKNTAGCPSSTINLGSSAPAGWSTVFSPTSLTLDPGQVASVSMSKTVAAGTAPGMYAVNASAADGSMAGSTSAGATVLAAPSLATSLTVSGASFSAKQTASFVATALYAGAPASGVTVTFTLMKADNSAVSRTVSTGSAGTASWSYKFAPKDPAGNWSVSARSNYQAQAAASNAVSFTVH